jgi:hypothetical protein
MDKSLFQTQHQVLPVSIYRNIGTSLIQILQLVLPVVSIYRNVGGMYFKNLCGIYFSELGEE